jgi:hypothetical protein
MASNEMPTLQNYAIALVDYQLTVYQGGPIHWRHRRQEPRAHPH